MPKFLRDGTGYYSIPRWHGLLLHPEFGPVHRPLRRRGPFGDKTYRSTIGCRPNWSPVVRFIVSESAEYFVQTPSRRKS